VEDHIDMDGRSGEGGFPPDGRAWTAESFAAWAAGRTDGDYELYEDGPRMMTGAYWPHGQIVKNLLVFLDTRLPGHLNAYGPQDLIRTVGELSKAPDVFIAPLVTQNAADEGVRYFSGAIVVFEIVSDDRDDDFGVKLREYEAVNSILRYVILERDKAGYTMWSRADGLEPWTPQGYEDSKPIPLPEVGLELPLGVAYAKTYVLRRKS
jgi:Uma2 family endonuclease